MQSTCDELTGLGVENLGVVCDIQQRDDIDAMVAATVERFGRVDGLVNNAQTFRPMAPDRRGRRGRRRRLLPVGSQGHAVGDAGRVPAHARPEVGPHRRTSRRRWASPAAAGFAAYNASKEAIRALTRTAAREWGADGITVNAIAPAAATHHGEAGKQSEGYRIFIENCPMGRQGDPELDIGPLAWFLCSDACRYLTGHTFMADGGAFMWA